MVQGSELQCAETTLIPTITLIHGLHIREDRCSNSSNQIVLPRNQPGLPPNRTSRLRQMEEDSLRQRAIGRGRMEAMLSMRGKK